MRPLDVAGSLLPKPSLQFLEVLSLDAAGFLMVALPMLEQTNTRATAESQNVAKRYAPIICQHCRRPIAYIKQDLSPA